MIETNGGIIHKFGLQSIRAQNLDFTILAHQLSKTQVWFVACFVVFLFLSLWSHHLSLSISPLSFPFDRYKD